MLNDQIKVTSSVVACGDLCGDLFAGLVADTMLFAPISNAPEIMRISTSVQSTIRH